jgi:hypothetical protein
MENVVNVIAITVAQAQDMAKACPAGGIPFEMEVPRRTGDLVSG